jgi:hypothetical protein
MITISELAAAVGVTPHAAHNWLSRRRSLGVKVGGRRLVPRSTIGEYRKSQAVNRAQPLDAVPPYVQRALLRQTRKSGKCRLWTGPLGHDGLPRVVLTQSYPVGRYAYVARHGPPQGRRACRPDLRQPRVRGTPEDPRLTPTAEDVLLRQL